MKLNQRKKYYIFISLFSIVLLIFNIYHIYIISNIESTKNILLENNQDELAYTQIDYESDVLKFLKEQLKSEVHPVGSIYMSTTDSTVDQVASRFGGSWVRYSEGRTIVGTNTSYPINSTGGSTTATLTTANLPNHVHTYKPSGTVKSTFSGTSVNSTTNGDHNHTVYGIWAGGNDSGISLRLQTDGNMCLYYNSGGLWCNYSNGHTGNSYRQVRIGEDGTSSTNGNHYHQVTAAGNVSSSFSGTAKSTTACNNCSGSAFNIQNPYTSVYMYKRTA